MYCVDNDISEIMLFVSNLKEIVDRGYFTNYYELNIVKSVLNAETTSPNEWVRRFSYISLETKDKSNILHKRSVYECLAKNEHLQDLIELCFEMYFIYVKNELEQVFVERDLIEKTNIIVSSAIAFKRSKIIKFEAMEQLINEFLLYSIHQLAKLDEACIRSNKSTYIVVLLIKYMDMEAARYTIIVQVTKLLENLVDFLEKTKATSLKGIQSEILAIYLYLLNKCVESFSIPNRIIENKTINLDCIEKQLTNALLKLKPINPDYLQLTIQKIINYFE